MPNYGLYYCLHGYVRGVCGVCADPDHNCQAPRLKKQVVRLKAERDAARALVEQLKERGRKLADHVHFEYDPNCADADAMLRVLALTEKEIRRARGQ